MSKISSSFTNIETECPIITRASQINSGSFSKIYLVNEIAGRSLSNLPQLALKVPRTNRLGSKISLRSEYLFCLRIWNSNLSEAEKEALISEPILAKFNKKKLLYTKTYIGLLSKYRSEGSLFDYLKNHPLSIRTKIDIMTQLIYKMSLLSKIKAIYPDIKMRNILVDLKGNQLSVYFSDFGDCYFADTPKDFPEYGLPIAQEGILDMDVENLHVSARNARNNPEDKGKQADLEKISNIYMSRALGLLLCSFFSGKSVISEGTYSLQQLNKYLSMNPLSGLNPVLAQVILRMLGIGTENNLPLQPQEAWDEWNKIIMT